MGTFTAAFRPALNKDGYAKLTFLGSSTQSGKKEDGTDWEIFKLIFEVLGAVRGTNQKISIVSNFTYAEDNLLGIALRGMGFVSTPSDSVEDDNGFLVDSVSEDDDGFETVNDAIPDIEGFVKNCVGQVFIAKINKATEGKRKGYWEIDVNTLTPFVKG